MAASDDLHDRIVRHAISLQRYGNGVVGRLIAILNKADAELFAALFEALENMPGTFKAARLEELLASVRAINEAAYNRIGRELKDELRAFVAAETEFQSQLLIRAAPVNVSFAAVSAEQVFTAAYAQPFRISKDGAVPMAQYLSGLSSARAKLVRDAVSLGWLEGQTIDQVVRRIRGTKAKGFEDGLMEAPRRHVEGMVRTAINHMSNTTSQRVWKANDDLVKGWRFVATLDSRTSMRCASLDQSVHPVGKGPIPPLHINCRSTSIPELKTWREMGIDVDDFKPGTRASAGGQVAADMSYSDWLRSQPVSVQDEVLGSTRGRLFRAGKLEMSAFVNNKGETLTLSELRQRNAALFEKAGV